MVRQQDAICPECGEKMWRIGKRLQNRRGDKKQMYRCSRCRFSTSNPIFKTKIER